MISIRRLRVDDWSIWRELRLEALRLSPHAFSSRLRDWAGAADQEERWRNRLTSAAANFIAEESGVPVGMVSVSRLDGRRLELTSMYVAPASRGSGVGDLLIGVVVQWAASDPSLEQIDLSVYADNLPAVSLYQRHHFLFTDSAPSDAGVERRMSRRLTKRVRIGVHSGQQYADFASVQRLWQDAQCLGYDWISLFDHYRPPIAGPAGDCLDGPTLLAALAATTPRVRCALLVAPPFWRHPALAAVAAATIDQVSGGRLEFGVGAGGGDLAFAQYGIERPATAVRYDMLDEMCQVLRLLWSGGPVDFDGAHYRLDRAYLSPRPVQERVPLVVGGAGRKRTLPLVARHADTWNTAVLPQPVYAVAAQELDRLCDLEGRDPAEIRRSMTFRCVISGAPAGVSRAAVTANGHAQDLPEYVSFGSATECLEQLMPYVDMGVRDFLLGLRPPVDQLTMERFATDVAPALRAAVTA